MRRNKKPPRLDLTPVMDVIFIFIFFLLMSAQFINIHQIGTEAPIVSEVNPEKNPLKPLNLTLFIKKDLIEVKTGLDEKPEGKFSFEELQDLNKLIVNLKEQHPKERTAIIRPEKSVPYKNIIKVIDTLKNEMPDKLAGRKLASSKELFNQIVFETQE